MASVLCVGHAVQDYVFSVDAIPATADKHRARGFSAVGGGPAANAAVAVSRLGGRAILAARVGDDRVGREMTDDLTAEGVDASRVRRFANCRSSVSAVMVDPRGERMIVNHLDASLPQDPGWLLADLPLGLDAVLGDVRWPAGSAAALSWARAEGLPAVLDADRTRPEDRFVLEAASHVAFSASGLVDYAGSADLEGGARLAAERLRAWVCVTDGARGACAVDGRSDASRRARWIGGFSVDAVDTLGAGDVWHGAFALALGEGRGEDDAVRFANAAAAVKVTRVGGRAGAPNRAETLAFLEDAKELEPAK